MALKPLIGVTACVKQIGLHPYHISGDKYLRAVSVAALGLPVAIPSLRDLTEIDDLLPQLDGLLLTGSPSNVEPFHYQGPDSAPGTDHDPARDATTLPLIRTAIQMGLPLLAICRGMQELNVALGGSLDQRIQDLPSRMDHSTPSDQPISAVRTGKAHKLRLVAEEGYGELARRWTSLDPADHEAWIRASSHAYVAFALERPGLFALMFRFRPALIEGPGEIEDPVATAVFAEALAVIERASADGLLRAAPPLELALGLWSACHGVATVLSMSPDLARDLCSELSVVLHLGLRKLLDRRFHRRRRLLGRESLGNPGENELVAYRLRAHAGELVERDVPIAVERVVVEDAGHDERRLDAVLVRDVHGVAQG